MALIAASALVPAARLRDAATLGTADGVRLVLPWSYLLLAPFCDVLDTLTLFNVRQHIALLATTVGGYVLWRVTRPTGAATAGRGRRMAREAVLGVGALGVLVTVYATGALIRRPMARLEIADPDAVVVDFHAHTLASHDGRRGHTAEDVRRWHRAAGFDVVYVTDHSTFAGAREGMTRNPSRAAEGTVVLSGVERIWRGQHVNVLGDTSDMIAALALRPAPPARRPPSIVLTVPGDLRNIPRADREYAAGITAIELSDGAPRGLQQIERDRGAILTVADSLGLTVVSGSDNHGWGYTAVAWTVLHLPGARNVSADSLDAIIRGTMARRGRAAARVVERHSPDTHDSRVAAAFVVPTAAWQLLRELSLGERASWLLWTLGLVIAASWADRRRG
ncbi:MAG: hypothetical protein NVS9B3_00860 [Gemmatimonadaceae bacterium]